MNTLFEKKPIVITALHFPSYCLTPKSSMAQLEDYVLNNLLVFSQGGIPAVILQDETYNENLARPETLTVMSAVARLARREFPDITLGIIIEAHDPIAALAVAHASGASFIRLKVFVGAMLKSSGVQQGCGGTAIDYRNSIDRNDIAILADVHDRTGVPLKNVPIEMAANWASKVGADSLILTGSNPVQSNEYIKIVRNSGIKKPLLVGGGVTSENVLGFLENADGVIVSTALMKSHNEPDDMIKWDLEKVRKFMEVVNSIG